MKRAFAECHCNNPSPLFEIGKPTVCGNCGQRIEICPAPDASDDGKRSSGIGELPLSGLSDTAYLIQLLRNSERQELQINELNKSVQFLAQQVKTLVDALAEDADPDAPMTNYLSGKPI